jgi:hypothetical protein
MYPTMRDFQEQDYYRRRKMQEAELASTIRMISKRDPGVPSSLERLFIKFGDLLERTGSRIKSRYEAGEAEMSSPAVSEHGYLGC